MVNRNKILRFVEKNGPLNTHGGYVAGNYSYKASKDLYDDIGDFLYASPDRVVTFERHFFSEECTIDKNYISPYNGIGPELRCIEISVPDYSEGFLFDDDIKMDLAMDFILDRKERFGSIDIAQDLIEFSRVFEDGSIKILDKGAMSESPIMQ
jgi:hypothetical protein